MTKFTYKAQRWTCLRDFKGDVIIECDGQPFFYVMPGVKVSDLNKAVKRLNGEVR